MYILKDIYKNQAAPELQKRFGYKNVMEIPKITKVVINTSVNTKREREALQEATKTIGTITGQKPIPTTARKSIANFKLREGQVIGAKVTLRNAMMFDFLTRLINNALPRVRDFRGVKASGFDGNGNFTMGLPEQSIFTEIDLDKIKHTVGMNITICTTAKSDEEAKALIELIGFPFAK